MGNVIRIGVEDCDEFGVRGFRVKIWKSWRVSYGEFWKRIGVEGIVSINILRWEGIWYVRGIEKKLK